MRQCTPVSAQGHREMGIGAYEIYESDRLEDDAIEARVAARAVGSRAATLRIGMRPVMCVVRAPVL